jgi:hypothetical protein
VPGEWRTASATRGRGGTCTTNMPG